MLISPDLQLMGFAGAANTHEEYRITRAMEPFA